MIDPSRMSIGNTAHVYLRRHLANGLGMFLADLASADDRD